MMVIILTENVKYETDIDLVLLKTIHLLYVLFTGLIRDTFGSYDAVFYGSSGFALAIALNATIATYIITRRRFNDAEKIPFAKFVNE